MDHRPGLTSLQPSESYRLAIDAARLAAHEGQSPGPLQEKATSMSLRHLAGAHAGEAIVENTAIEVPRDGSIHG